MSEKRPPNACGKCDARWSGSNIAHCRACHRTFTTPATFDQHRSAKYADLDGKRVQVRENGQCYDPADDGLVQNDRGQWHRPSDGFDFKTLGGVA